MKNYFKRSLSVILALTIIFSSVYVGLNEIDFSGLFAVKAEAASTSDLTFALNSEGASYSVTDCNSSASGSLIIPSTYNGKPVTSIGDYAFSGCTSLTSITIPNSVTSISEGAFLECTSFTSITIPDSVTSIGGCAFQFCTRLTSITIPDSVTSIGYCAFSFCESLTSITIPDSVTSIGGSAFSYCISLTSITIPDGVTRIADSAFNYCPSLTSITIPDSVTSIGDNAFYCCDSLTSITIPDSVTSIDSSAFTSCTSLTSIVIPDSVTSIGDYAFYDCYKLISVTIGKGVTSIGSCAFDNCTSLKDVCYKGLLSEWNNIAIATNNTYLTNATISHLCTTGDNWVTDKEATCEIDGSKSNKCTVCGATLETVVIPAKGHTEVVDAAIDVTCTETGLTEGKHCSVCNAVIVAQQTVPATGHQPESEWEIRRYATCEGDGYKLKYCTVCYEIAETEDIPAKGHRLGDTVVVEANCWEDGYEYQPCLDCEMFFEYKDIPATGHNLTDWIINTPATCTAPGGKHKACTDCGAVVEIGELDATGHTEVKDEAIEATCTENGRTEGSHCSVCNEVIVAPDIIDAKGHISSDWIIDKNATCTEAGSKHKECVTCGETIEISEIAIIPHEKSDWIIDVAPVCTTSGSKHIECIDCGKILETAIILATGHTVVTDSAIASTCTTTGLTEGSHCSVCNVVIVAQNVVPSKGHTASDWIVDRDSTCTEKGLKHKDCTVCGVKLETTEIVEKEHTAGSWKTEKKATVNAAGKKVQKCTECGKNLKTAEIVQLKCSKPKLSKVENTEYGVKITWGKVSGADKYYVYRKTGSNGKFSRIGSTTKTYYTDKKASSGKKYYYIVKAINEAGSSSSSSSLSKYYLADPTLNTPKSTKSGITLKWKKVSGADGYMVYRKTGSGSYSKIATVKGNTKVTYTDKKAKKGKTYTYKIKAYKSKTYSAYSNAKKIKDKY